MENGYLDGEVRGVVIIWSDPFVGWYCGTEMKLVRVRVRCVFVAQ